jgi:hypothetical protein
MQSCRYFWLVIGLIITSVSNAQSRVYLNLDAGNPFNFWEPAKYDKWKDIGLQPLVGGNISLSNGKLELKLGYQRYWQQFEERSLYPLSPNTVYLSIYKIPWNNYYGLFGVKIAQWKNLSFTFYQGFSYGAVKTMDVLRRSQNGERLYEIPYNSDWGNVFSLRTAYSASYQRDRYQIGLLLLADYKLSNFKYTDTNYPVNNEGNIYIAPIIYAGFIFDPWRNPPKK